MLRLTCNSKTGLFNISLIGLLLAACASQDTTNDQSAKDEWLKQSYAPPAANSKSSSLIELPKNQRYREAMLSGKIQRGMYLDEALATLRAKPYGTHEQVATYWCEATPVAECDVQCINCEALLFGQHQIVMMEGYGLQITVTDYYPKRFEDYRASVDQSAVRFAQAIYERNIVPGMPAGLVQMLINLQGNQVNYFCNDSVEPSTESCLGRCDECRLEITPRSNAQSHKIIRLETHAGQQSVSEILTR